MKDPVDQRKSTGSEVMIAIQISRATKSAKWIKGAELAKIFDLGEIQKEVV